MNSQPPNSPPPNSRPSASQPPDGPAGPPSGPLSGPSRPEVPPPPPPSGGSGGSSGGGPAGPPPGPGGTFGGGTSGPPPGGGPQRGAPGPEPGPPWWRSVPRIAAIATALVAALVLAVVLTRPGGGSGGEKELFLQAASSTGPDPFTESTVNGTATATPTASPSAPSTAESGANVIRSVRGSAPGLYGGTRDVASCDVEKQITALGADESKNRAFAEVLDIEPGSVPAYLRSLTSVQLRWDTRVTNHGYKDGSATSYQAVLQAGTAVLIDERGVPRVRCACGNPLLPPVAQQGTLKPTGDSWPGYRPSNVVVVAPAVTEVEKFVIYDAEDKKWLQRPAGDTGGKDKETAPPKNEALPSPDESPPHSRCPADGSDKSCPPAGESPTSESGSPESPSSGTPSPEKPASPPGEGTSPEPDAPPSEPEPEPDSVPQSPQEAPQSTDQAPQSSDGSAPASPAEPAS
ncbi:DUF6777 domain-containing protein [Streptomyces sp. NPDC058572]|uniref:DUF6777 domain-containing protein n=1 Tax=Streptomyces sp. NPDC058572 TaxID=3346546 RepID=UPI00365C144A